MATRYDDSEGQFKDLLTCSICLEVFKIPKYLPCLHTFCESCISTYISSCIEKDGEIKELKCPVCKGGFALEETLGLPKQWAKNLPLNHLAVSMIDKQAIAKSEKLCNSCEVNLETVKAVSWCTVCEEGLCKVCEKYHRSFKMTSSHLIILLEKMKDDNTTVIIGGMVGCENHEGKVVEFYCVDHSKPCCKVCATLFHRKCETVISIDSAALGIKESPKAKVLSKRLQEKSEHIHSLITNRKENIRLVESKSCTILTDIDNVKDTVIKHLHELVDKANEHVTASKKNAVISLTDEVTELSSLKSIVDNWKTIFETCLQDGSDQQCLVEMDKIILKNAEQDRYNDILSQTKILSVKFEVNKILAGFPTNVQSFGVLSHEKSIIKVNSGLPSANFRTGKITVVHTIEFCYGNGIFVDDYVVFTDCVNKRIVKYNASYVYNSELLLPKKVSDITRMDQDTVAVASWNGHDIFIIHITNMTLNKTITTSCFLSGLQYVEGGFIIAYSESLTWITTDGTILNVTQTKGLSFSVCSLGRDTCICPDLSAVSCFTKDGNRTFTYKNPTMTFPGGIDVDCEGNIWILDCESENIHQLTNEGEFIRIIPTIESGIKPWGLRFKQGTATFLLTSNEKVFICTIE